MYLKLTVLFALLSYTSLSAQSVLPADSMVCNNERCTCDKDLTPAGVMISHVHARNEWMASYRFMGMSMSGVHSGTKELGESEVLKSYDSSPSSMHMSMHMLMLMYGVTDRLTLMGMAQYSSNYMEMTMQAGERTHKHSMSSSGMSDTKLYALYALHENYASQLVLSMGVNLPTGSIDVKGESGSSMFANRRYPYSMQLGSGTVDVLPGLSYLHQKNDLALAAQITADLRTGRNKSGYQLGNEVGMNCWIAKQWLNSLSTSLRVEATQTGKIKGSDVTLNSREDIGANSTNFGGSKIFTFIGLCLQGKAGFLQKNRLQIEYGLPIYQYVNGLQMPVKNSLFAAWSFTF